MIKLSFKRLVMKEIKKKKTRTTTEIKLQFIWMLEKMTKRQIEEEPK